VRESKILVNSCVIRELAYFSIVYRYLKKSLVLTTDQKVGGSNPSGRAIVFNNLLPINLQIILVAINCQIKQLL